VFEYETKIEDMEENIQSTQDQVDSLVAKVEYLKAKAENAVLATELTLKLSDEKAANIKLMDDF